MTFLILFDRICLVFGKTKKCSIIVNGNTKRRIRRIVEQSDEKALEYFRKAADMRFAKSQFALGSLYASGTGVEQ